MKKWIFFLESKTASVVCLLIALISRGINVFYVSFTGRDKMIGVMQSKSFLEGNGFSIPRYFIDDPYTVTYDHTPYWPPGYPLFLSPILKLFNYDIYKSTTVLDLLTCIALIFLLRKIARQTGFTTAAANILTLIAGCFEYSFISESLPTDNLAILFLCLAVSFSIRIFSDQKFHTSQLIFCGFLLFMPNFFRYAYPAASLGIPVLIIITGLLIRQTSLVKKGAVVLGVTGICLAGFWVYMTISTGSSSYALPTERGIYPGHLIHWYPVVPSSFINTPFLSSQLIQRLGIPLVTLLKTEELVNIVAIICITGSFIYLLRKKYFSQPDSFKWFLLIGFTVSVSIFASLGYLSLTYASQDSPGRSWNYNYESRYYGFVFIFIQFCFVAVLFKTKWNKKILSLLPVFLGLLLLCIEVTHNIYFNTKLAFAFKSYKTAVYREQDYRQMIRLIKESEDQNPDWDIMTAGYNDEYYGYIGTYMHHTGLADPLTLNQQLPAVRKKTVLFLMIYNHDKPLFNPFLEKNGVIEVKRLAESSFYRIEITP